MASMNEILNAIDQLPSLPASVLQITGMLSAGKANVSEIEQVARRDEALSMTILRYANSASYGRPGRIFNLRESIVRLGGSALMKIVLQQKISGLYAGAGSSYGLGRGALWRGALGGAIATERLGKSAGLPDADLCFLCALLRDCGKLALDMQFGHGYLSRVIGHLTEGRSFVEAERSAFGFDHAELGAELARRWGLPKRICQAIRFHHEPPSTGPDHDLLFDIVHAADVICLWAGLAVGHDGLQYRLAEHVRQALRLDRKAAENDIAYTWTRLREMEDAMNLTVPQDKIA